MPAGIHAVAHHRHFVGGLHRPAHSIYEQMLALRVKPQLDAIKVGIVRAHKLPVRATHRRLLAPGCNLFALRLVDSELDVLHRHRRQVLGDLAAIETTILAGIVASVAHVNGLQRHPAIHDAPAAGTDRQIKSSPDVVTRL